MIVSSIEASEGTGLGVAAMLRSSGSDSGAAVEQIEESFEPDSGPLKLWAGRAAIVREWVKITCYGWLYWIWGPAVSEV